MSRKRFVEDYTTRESNSAFPAPAAQGREGEPPEPQAAEKKKPVHEIRISRVKAVIWENATTEGGVRHNVTFRRIFKRDQQGAQWEQSDSFGRDEIPLLEEVARRAWLWIYEQHQA
jgi:hypothetical protein